jgi:hypothetical protein
VRAAEELGCGVNLSVYTDSKNGNRTHLLGGEHLARWTRSWPSSSRSSGGGAA